MFDKWETLKNRIHALEDRSVLLEMKKIEQEEEQYHSNGFQTIADAFKTLPFVTDVYVQRDHEVVNVLLLTPDDVAYPSRELAEIQVALMGQLPYHLEISVHEASEDWISDIISDYIKI